MRKPGHVAVKALAVVVLICVGVILAAPTVTTAQSASLEYPIKAAYLLNFAKLTEWPTDAFAGPDSPIAIGIIGTDPFGSTLELTLGGKTISNRRLVLKRLQWGEDMRRCHILFLSSADGARIGKLASQVAGLPVLIVAETPDSAERGAMINFKIEGGRVRFEANVEAARRARLSISSQLLTYATIVKEQ